MERILLVKGIEGLGNRILCLLTGSLYARLSGRRLVIDWRDESYSKGGANAFDHFFLSPACTPLAALLDTDSVAPEIWRGHLDKPAWWLREHYGALQDAQGWRRFSIDLSRLDYAEQVAVMWTYADELDPLIPYLKHAEGAPAGATRSRLLRELLTETLTLHPAIREMVDQFKREHFGERVVGVHIRYSDHRTALWTTLKAVRQLLGRDPARRIFLCTDNMQIKRLFERKYQQVVSNPHWYAPRPGDPLHCAAERPDPITSGIEALIDLYLLAECDDMILDTSSSFAYLATLLTNASAEHVYDVKRRDKLPPRIRKATTGLMRSLHAHSWAPTLIGKLVG
jgi:hypothetical protein